jgi:ribonuclease D
VRALAERLAPSRSLALDTESDSLHHYFEKVCLVQVASDRGEAFLIDPLSARDLSPLAPLIADPGIEKVFHGADYDVSMMRRDFQFSFGGLFDTMIAARFLGLKEIGLQALAAAELGVSISKDSQKDDWSRRPLEPAQEAYALADVAHLLELRDRLKGKLSALGRESWVREECDAVSGLPAARQGRDPEGYLRVKGASRLPPPGLRALFHLYRWRDALAAEADVPTFKIVGNETLIALATARPATLEDLGRIRGLPTRFRGRRLLEVLGQGEDPAQTTVPKRRPPAPSDAERRRVEALKALRNERAAALGVDVSVVLPQRLIELLAQQNPRGEAELASLDGLKKWRIATLGGAILERLRGAEAPQ